jgi:hypothetical protein
VLADAILENGENAHCTVRSPDWWRERVARHFGEAHRVPTLVSSACAFTTWRPSESAVLEAERLSRLQAHRHRTNRRLSRLKNSFRLLTHPPLSREALLAELDGKSVALVGNARSLSEQAHGADIDAHDVVVRFNGAIIPHTRTHGTRTTWVATGVPFTSGTARARGVQKVLWLPPSRKNLSAWMVRRKDADLYLHAPSSFARLAQEIGSERPSSGAVMIDLILSNPKVKQVSLYGFDFFASRSYSGDHTLQSTPHDFTKERAWVDRQAARDARLKLI